MARVTRVSRGRRAPSSILHPPSSPRRSRAFTLTEILIVVGLIVLLIALAVPTFSFLSGSRSVDSAQNQISALLGRARAEAIGLQETRGIFFFQDLRGGGVQVALVRETERPSPLPPYTIAGSLNPLVNVFLDLVPDAEFVSLPSGVGVQVLDDCRLVGGIRQDDAYIGFNTYNRGNNGGSIRDQDSITPYGGVILFDSSGRLVTRTYAFKTYLGANGSAEPTRIGDLLFRPTGSILSRDHVLGTSVNIYDLVPEQRYTGVSGAEIRPPRSSLGLVLYDKEAFRGGPTSSNQPRDADPEIYNNAGEYSMTERAEEDWLDQNSLSLLVNRYNGTVVKGE